MTEELPVALLSPSTSLAAEDGDSDSARSAGILCRDACRECGYKSPCYQLARTLHAPHARAALEIIHKQPYVNFSDGVITEVIPGSFYRAEGAISSRWLHCHSEFWLACRQISGGL